MPNVPRTPRIVIGTAAARNLPQADAHAAVEEDRDQRQRRHALDVLEREQAREPVGEVGGDRRDDEEQRGRREPDPGGDDADDDRDRERARDDEDDAPEVDDVVHDGDSPCCAERGGRGRRAANRFLTGVSLQPHAGSRYFMPYAPRGSDPARPRAVRRGSDGRGQGARRLALDRGRARHRPDHRQGRARRADGEGLARDHRPQPDRPVEPPRERDPTRQGGHAPRQERLVLRARRPLPARRHAAPASRSRRAAPAPSCSTATPTPVGDTGRYAIGDAACRAAARRATKASFGPSDASAPSSQSVKIQP